MITTKALALRAIALPAIPIVGFLLLPPMRFPTLTTPHLVALFAGVPYLLLLPFLIVAVTFARGDSLPRIVKLAPLAHVALAWGFFVYVSGRHEPLGFMIVRLLLVGLACVLIDYFYIALARSFVAHTPANHDIASS